MKTPHKYRIVITMENYIDDESVQSNLLHYADHPEDGLIETIFWFTDPKDLDELMPQYEGLFYILSVVKDNIAELSVEIDNKNVIGYGFFDPDDPYENIEEYEREENEQRSDD